MFLIFLTGVFVALYIYTTRNFDYWCKRNVKHDPPIAFFGNDFKNTFGFVSITDLSTELYHKYPNEKVIGYYRFSNPMLIVKDLDIIRRILTSDFSYFHNRGLGRNPDVEPMFANLFHVNGDKWKLLRKRLTPTFTTAKLKGMFPLVVECAEKLQGVVEKVVANGGVYDARELMARFTTEFIGACGFGIEMDSISNENSLFRHLGKILFTRQFRHVIKLTLWEAFPWLRKHIYVADREVEETIIKIVRSIREQRNFKPSGRNDFIDLLLELETQGKLKGESIEKFHDDGTPIQVEIDMDLKCMAAQVFIFFGAGFETSSSATSFTLHQLAYNPDKQKKVQEEIDRVMAKYDNRLCYDSIADMEYLNMAFNEAMRMFPSLGCLNRVCTKNYTIPELNLNIDRGVKIVIPVQAIQNDPKHFDKPEEFLPERFASKCQDSRHHFSFLPFGEGPRVCVGARLGLMQSLAGLAAILHRFRVEPASQSVPQLKVNPRNNVVQTVMGGIPLLFKRRTEVLT